MADRHQETVDYELQVWAQTILIGSRQPTEYDKVKAYRVLARTNPRSYRARLARALVSWSYYKGHKALPQVRLALLKEATAAAREVPEGEPRRAELVVDVLDSYQRLLYEMGRRAEGLAVREEMAAVTRRGVATGERGRVMAGLRVWALGLAEEARHGEAAVLLAELLDVTLPEDRWGSAIWDRHSLTAQLHAAGRTNEAITNLKAIVDEDRGKLLTDSTSLSGMFLTLVWYALLLDRVERQQDATATRREALILLQRLAATGEPKNWSGAQFTEAGILIAAQAQDAEPLIGGGPRPAFGTDPADWSPDLRTRYFDETGGPWCGAPATDETGTLRDAVRRETRLPDLAALQRRLALRTAVYWLWHHSHRFLEPTLPFFNDSVAAARQLKADERNTGQRTLARALTDRAMVQVAGHRYPDALTDYTEAVNLLTTAERATPGSAFVS